MRFYLCGCEIIRKPLAYGRRRKTLPCSLYSFGVFFIFLFIFVILLMLGMQVFELLSFFSSRLLNLGALIYIPRIDDLSRLQILLSKNPQLKFKADGSTFIHYYLYSVSHDSRTKTQASLVFFQSLVIPYILAFKGACPVHPIYAANGDLTPANNICSYPAFTNVISGFEFNERVQCVIDPVSKVLGVYISSEMDN